MDTRNDTERFFFFIDCSLKICISICSLLATRRNKKYIFLDLVDYKIKFFAHYKGGRERLENMESIE